LAELRHETLELLAAQTTANAYRLFNLWWFCAISSSGTASTTPCKKAKGAKHQSWGNLNWPLPCQCLEAAIASYNEYIHGDNATRCEAANVHANKVLKRVYSIQFL
jgi:hypothetical protein